MRFFPLWIDSLDITKYQLKIAFTSLWGPSFYRVMPFGLKNVGTNFKNAMCYYFHDPAHLILANLDDFTTHSKLRPQHLAHLCTIFL